MTGSPASQARDRGEGSGAGGGSPASRALVECVPNFSEGRDREVLAELRGAVSGVAGAELLDVHVDPWHHRSVFTLAGAPAPVAEAALEGVRVAVRRIDLTRHRGQHPRIGAADVVPFVPLRGLEMSACVHLAEETAARVADEFGVPVYLYGRAARRRERRTLAGIRRGEFEHLREAVGKEPGREPDFGPARLHPTAGATCVGAREVLVAYNVWLAAADVELARGIAREIRTSSGGLPAVQALGFLVGGRAQVSVNLLDVDVTPPVRVFRAVAALAARAGVRVEKSEIVGLAPERSLPADAARILRLEVDPAERSLEARLRRAGLLADGEETGRGGRGPDAGAR